jgi:hypothetical protein
MIWLATKFIYICMTFKMLHKHDKKIKKHIVKEDLTRCGHKKYYKKNTVEACH